MLLPHHLGNLALKKWDRLSIMIKNVSIFHMLGMK